jgi:hypothetical protein
VGKNGHGYNGNGGDEYAHIARFLARYGVDCSDPFGCWLWPFELHRSGYVRLTVGGEQTTGARLVWALSRGILNTRRHLWHSCTGAASRRCLNPRHLTTRDPARVGLPRRSKLTVPQVRRLRRAYAKGARLADLAGRYGVTVSTAWEIARRKSWRSVAA